MKLFYDQTDLAHAKKLKDDRFKWLRELGATELSASTSTDRGFLFGYEHGEVNLNKQVKLRPGIRDQPGDRGGLVLINELLDVLAKANVNVPTPKTWVIGVDDPLPALGSR